MKIRYKIENESVQRCAFKDTIANQQLLEIWENVVEENKMEFEHRQAAIVFKINDNNFRVLTDTSLLFKLAYEVKKQLNACLTAQKVVQLT